MQGLLATQMNHLVHDGKLTQNSLVQVRGFVKNEVQGRNLVVLLDAQVMEPNPGVRLGEPVDIASAGSENIPPTRTANTNTAAPAAPLYGNSNKPVKPEGGSNNPYSANNNNNNPYGSSNPYNRSSGSSAPIVRTTPGGSNYTDIANLNMYQTRWTIRARITTKSDVRTWSNARGEGSLFSAELLDQSGVDIKAAFFKEAVDKFYNMLEEGKVYTFSGGRIKVANMQFNNCKSNFEISFDQNAEIHLDNDAGDIQHQTYDFVPSIAALEQVEANKTVDVLAIVKSVGEPTTLVSKKSGKELTKADLVLVDDSGVEINMAVWGDKANTAPRDFAGNPIVAFKKARVSDFGGKSLSLSGAAVVRPEDVPQYVSRLEQWWNNGGSAGGSKSLSSSAMGGGAVAPFNERLDVASIKGRHMGHGDKPDWLTFKGTVAFIKKDKNGGAWYPACANSGDPCKNMYKMTQTTDGSWFCDKCQGTFDNPVRRWIFSAVVADDTASTWVSFFNPQAETLLGGETADNIYTQFKNNENDDPDGYESVFQRALFSEWVFKCKVKSEIVNDEARIKTSVSAMQPVDYVKESEDMLAALQKWS